MNVIHSLTMTTVGAAYLAWCPGSILLACCRYLIIVQICNVYFTNLGQGNIKAKQVADAMLDGVVEVLSQNSSSTLQKIRIVIFQPPMLKEFYDSMRQREAPDDKAVSWFASFSGRVKGMLREENFNVHIP